MRSFLPAYDLQAPRNLPEALALLECEPGVWKPFAGGTDLMVLFEAGALPQRKFLGLWHLSELRDIEVTAEQVTLGALATYTQILENTTLQREGLRPATAGPDVQNRHSR